MIFDLTSLLSNNQQVLASAGSDNVIDLRGTGTVYGAAAAITRDVGKGCRIPLRCQVSEAFNNLTSLTVSVQVDDNTAFSSAKTVFQSPAYALADLTIGGRLLLPDQIPIGTDERYMRLFYTIAGAAPTTGRIVAGVTAANQTN